MAGIVPATYEGVTSMTISMSFATLYFDLARSLGEGIRAHEISRALHPHNLKYHYAACHWVLCALRYRKYRTMEAAIEALTKENRVAEVESRYYGRVNGYYIPWGYMDDDYVRGCVMEENGSLCDDFTRSD